MALYRRKNGYYYVKISIPGRKPFRCSTGTRDKREAQEFHDKKAHELWLEQRLDVKPRRTWDEAALKWLQEKKDKASYRDDVRYVRWFTQHLRGLHLDEIGRELVDDLLTRYKADVSDRTRDLYVALVRGIFRRANREWGWIDHVPPFRTYERKTKGRIRWLTEEQVRALLWELPPHIRPVMLFSLATGLRMGNVLGLRWSDIDGHVAYIERTKNNEPLTVPLNNLARAVLDQVRGQCPTHVFSYRGKPLRCVNTRAWRKALKRAKIENFRWHDLRHTWASWLRQKGVPTWALQGLAGWKSESMANRYAHINVDHLRPFAGVLDTLLDTPDLSEELKNALSH